MTVARQQQDISIKTETFASYDALFKDKKVRLNWNCLFVLPLWLQTWWDAFGGNQTPEFLAGYRYGDVIGIAPLQIRDQTARFIGGKNVCDYQDMITASNHQNEFLIKVLTHLKNNGVRLLELETLRPDSVALTRLPQLAEQMGYAVSIRRAATSYEIVLPPTWDDYLYMLKGKQRHEIRRKLRRLDEAGHVRFRIVKHPHEIADAMDTFFSMFKAGRPDKSEFLTAQMASFFRLLAQKSARQGLLKMFFMDIDQTPAAGVMCFDYNDTLFLYNNGYNPQFGNLSPGFLSKVYSIRNSIEQAKLRYDLLKGDETYKKQLGGTPVALYNLKIALEK